MVQVLQKISRRKRTAFQLLSPFINLWKVLFIDLKCYTNLLQVTDRVFGLALWYHEADLLEVWTKDRPHPPQDQEPLGDRKYIKNFEFLQKLTEFEESIGMVF